MTHSIVSSLDLNRFDHLGDFKTCEHCGLEQDFPAWQKQATILVIDTVWDKRGSLVTVMECPKCFETMWVHAPFAYFLSDEAYPEEWVVAANKERERRTAIALKEWENGICKTCKHLEKHYMETSGWRSCTIGLGPALTECEIYVAHD